VLVKKPFYTKTSFWRWVLILSLVMFYCVLFWGDVVSVYFLAIGVFLQGKGPGDAQYEELIQKRPEAVQNSLVFILVFILFLVAVILFASQFILPVRTLRERWLMFGRLYNYALGRPGPAIFIRDGKEISSVEERNRPYPGVVFVDMNSAVVLERKSKPTTSNYPTRTLMDRLTGRPGSYPVIKMARAEGPGIVFISPKERIRGVADLRRQFRTNMGPAGADGKPEGVKAYTSDGIEVSSAVVITIFSLGQMPDVLDVAYVGGEKPENLRVITIGTKKVKEGEGKETRWRQVEFIKGISQDNDTTDMDIEDKREIHGFAQDRRQIEGLLDELEKRGLGEEALLSFVRGLGLKKSGAVEKFIGLLYANQQAAYRSFINRMKPIDTETMHRFVINKAFLFQLVESLIPEKSESRQVTQLIELLFTKYQLQVKNFYTNQDETCREIITRFIRRFYTEQEATSTYRSPRRIGSSPFYFDERRIFAALYAYPRVIPEQQETASDNWTKLPPQIATEYYRSIIARYQFDKLLGLENLDKPSLVGEAKGKFGRTMRYQGVLAYRLIRRRDGAFPKVGDELNSQTYLLDHPQLELRNPKVLRDRGIKIIAGSFSELRISDIAISNQRIDNWLARWESEAEQTMSEFEIEIMRSRAQARAKAQRELIQNLSDVFSQPYTKEAMAVRIFQSLESAASDPETRRLLPQETLTFIQNLRGWLIKDTPPGEKPSPPQPPGTPPPFIT
jgi:hypothetical protein